MVVMETIEAHKLQADVARFARADHPFRIAIEKLIAENLSLEDRIKALEDKVNAS
jgi:hypothetical protein